MSAPIWSIAGATHWQHEEEQAMSWLIWIGSAIALLALLIGRKLTRDPIRQGGRRVGSALLARYVPPDAQEARFLV